METGNSAEKPKRLYFKTYLQLIRNSVGTEMFRNFYIQTSDGVETDALSDGSNSCAFYIGDNRAVSTSWMEKKVVEHDVYFDGARSIGHIFRHHEWES